MMAEENRKGSGGASGAFLRASSDERKPPSPAPAAAAVVSAKKVIVKSADMKEDVQKEAIGCALAEFDKNHGPTWHCIVGRNFETCIDVNEDARRPSSTYKPCARNTESNHPWFQKSSCH